MARKRAEKKAKEEEKKRKREEEKRKAEEERQRVEAELKVEEDWKKAEAAAKKAEEEKRRLAESQAQKENQELGKVVWDAREQRGTSKVSQNNIGSECFDLLFFFSQKVLSTCGIRWKERSH